MFGLSGASRTGKSTLARKYAELAKLEFVETRAADIFRQRSAGMSQEMSFDDRLSIQEAILAHLEECYRQAPKTFITDRTPLDCIAYTLADVQRSTLDPQQAAALGRYIARCYQVTNQYFGSIVVVQPGIMVVADGGKPVCPGYAEHINALVMGASVSERLYCQRHFIPRSALGLQERVDYLHRIVRSVCQGVVRQRDAFGACH